MIKNNSFNLPMLLLACIMGISTTGYGQTNNIKNDVFWNTKDGQPINSQGGGIFKFTDSATGIKKYYWYGVHYEEADSYRKKTSVTLI